MDHRETPDWQSALLVTVYRSSDNHSVRVTFNFPTYLQQSPVNVKPEEVLSKLKQALGWRVQI